MFSFFNKRSVNQQIISGLYHSVAKAALQPWLFSRFTISDTLGGRFEILLLHMVIVLRHLRRWEPPAQDVAKDLTDYYFLQLDDVLRELGTSDNKVPKKMKEMAAFYLQRSKSYDKLFEAEDADGLQKLLINYFGNDVEANGLASYALAADKALRDANLDFLMKSDLSILWKTVGDD